MFGNVRGNEKQPSIGVLRKRCCENVLQIYRRTPMPKFDFNKVARQLSEHLFVGTPSEGCFWKIYYVVLEDPYN